MPTALFTQRASGKAVLPVDPVACCHCGIDGDTLHLQYRICLVWQCDSLDTNGFLLDNLTFRQYWQDKAGTPLTISCEELCRMACTEFFSMRPEHVISCSVELTPFAGVSVEYSCRSD